MPNRITAVFPRNNNNSWEAQQPRNASPRYAMSTENIKASVTIMFPEPHHKKTCPFRAGKTQTDMVEIMYIETLCIILSKQQITKKIR